MTCGPRWSWRTRASSPAPGGDPSHQALCLNLVTNAVIVWNTVYMAAVIEQLKQEGTPVPDSDLAHVWPTRYAHINMYGKYHFNVEEAQGRQGLLRSDHEGDNASAQNFSISRGSLLANVKQDDSSP